MKITLKIWKNQREIEKEYAVESYDLMWGTVEDLVETLNLDNLADNLKDESNNMKDLISVVGNIVKDSRVLVNETLKDVFEGLTDEEIRKTKISNVIEVIVELTKATLQNLTNLGGNNSKN